MLTVLSVAEDLTQSVSSGYSPVPQCIRPQCTTSDDNDMMEVALRAEGTLDTPLYLPSSFYMWICQQKMAYHLLHVANAHFCAWPCP